MTLYPPFTTWRYGNRKLDKHLRTERIVFHQVFRPKLLALRSTP